MFLAYLCGKNLAKKTTLFKIAGQGKEMVLSEKWGQKNEKETQQVTLKVLRWEERDKRLLIKEAQMVA
jgi:hypothetical protein